MEIETYSFRPISRRNDKNDRNDTEQCFALLHLDITTIPDVTVRLTKHFFLCDMFRFKQIRSKCTALVHYLNIHSQNGNKTNP